MTQSGNISGRVVLRLGRFMRARGHDPEPIFAAHGVSGRSLAAWDSRVPYSVIEGIGLRAEELLGIHDFGLELGSTLIDPETLADAGFLLLMASTNARTAFERAVRMQEYFGDGARFALVPEVGGLAVRYEYVGAGGPRVSRHTDECAMAEIVMALRYLTGAEVSPRRVAFRHARPARTRRHDELFRCPLAFGASHTEVSFDDTALDLPMRGAHHVYLEIFEREVERVLHRRPGVRAFSREVRTIVRGAIERGGDVTTTVARALRTSARTLQRRLHVEGTSLAAIVREERADVAQRRLAEGAAIKEVAAELGYSDPSAFHRAFKRWTGRTPAGVHGQDPDGTGQ